MGRRRQQKRGRNRQQQALAAQLHLLKVMEEPQGVPDELVDSSAVHLMKITRRHRLRIPPTHRHLVCRSCWATHTRSANVRVRIKAGQRIVTCTVCGDVRRHGGGPKFHRKMSTDVNA